MASKELKPSQDSPFKLFIKSQFRAKPKPPPKSTSLLEQTAIITGSNTGIGLECAQIFLDLKLAHLILAVRNVKKGEKVAESLRKTHPDATIDVWQLDMLSYDSIQAFTQKCSSNLSRLDIAILNAGITQAEFVLNKSTGHEEMLQVNYLSTALLAFLLLPILKSKSPVGSPGRLTIVSSGTGLISKFENHGAKPLIPSFNDPEGWDLSAASERYSVSKTLQMMLLVKLREHVDPKNVIINAVDPGFTSGSELHRHLSVPLRGAFGVMKALSGRSLEQGAWTYVDAAVVRGEESHGSYLMDWNISP